MLVFFHSRPLSRASLRPFSVPSSPFPTLPSVHGNKSCPWIKVLNSLTRHCPVIPFASCFLSSLQYWWSGHEARHRSCSLETSSWLSSACYCPRSTGFLWPLRTYDPSSRLFLDSQDTGPGMVAQMRSTHFPGSVCKLVSGIKECGQWGLWGSEGRA